MGDTSYLEATRRGIYDQVLKKTHVYVLLGEPMPTTSLCYSIYRSRKSSCTRSRRSLRAFEITPVGFLFISNISCSKSLIISFQFIATAVAVLFENASRYFDQHFVNFGAFSDPFSQLSEGRRVTKYRPFFLYDYGNVT